MNREDRREAERKRKASAERAIRMVALRHGESVAHVRKHIQIGMINGLVSDDPETKLAIAHINKAGEVPTPEEVVASLAEQVLCGGRSKEKRLPE